MAPRALFLLSMSTALITAVHDSRGDSLVKAVARADGDEETSVRWRADDSMSKGERAVQRAIKEAGAWPYYEGRSNPDVQWILELQEPPDYSRIRRTSVSSVEAGNGISIAFSGGRGEYWLAIKTIKDQMGRWSVDGDAVMFEKLGVPLAPAQLEELRKVDAGSDDATLLRLWRSVEVDPTDSRTSSTFANAVFDAIAKSNEQTVGARDAVLTPAQRSAKAKFYSLSLSGGGGESTGSKIHHRDGTYTQEPPSYDYVRGCALDGKQAFAVVGENATLSTMIGSYVRIWMDRAKPNIDSELDRAVEQWFAPVAAIDKGSFKERAEAMQKCLTNLLTREHRFKTIHVSFVTDQMDTGLIELLSAAELRPLVKNGVLAVEPVKLPSR